MNFITSINRDIFYRIVCFLFLFLNLSFAEECTQSDLTYAFTDCDTVGERWRVVVPKNFNCQMTPKLFEMPRKGKSCNDGCPFGQFLNMTQQLCTKCLPGTFSMGDGERYDYWPTDLKPHFHSYKRNLLSHHQCSSDGGWKGRQDYVSADKSSCASTMYLTVNLVKSGIVRFRYQFNDLSTVFNLAVQNSNCEEKDDDFDMSKKWLERTKPGKWRTHEVSLSKGKNVIFWSVFNMDRRSHHHTDNSSAVLIQWIEVTGLAFSTQCSHCRPGFFNADAGANLCKFCPKNTFTDSRGATECKKCPDGMWSNSGSNSCKRRPPCREVDYYVTWTYCNSKSAITTMKYQWIEPRICDDSKGVPLPTSKTVTCALCNPGTEPDDSKTCSYCASGMFSPDGKKCTSCPIGSQPVQKLLLVRWQSFPPDLTQESIASDMLDENSTLAGWLPAFDRLETSRSAFQPSQMLLKLNLKNGFEKSATSSPLVEFEFKLSCVGPCVFFFVIQSERRSNVIIKQWKSTTLKESFTYRLTHTEPSEFYWAFDKSHPDYEQLGQSGKNDMAQIFSINVTNVKHVGAVDCEHCPLGVDSVSSNCIPCPIGKYFFKQSCVSCPPGSVLDYIIYDNNSQKTTCRPCQQGTTPSNDGTDCVTQLKTSDRDLEPLRGIYQAQGGSLFTPGGSRYYHVFNFTLDTNTTYSDQPLCVTNRSLSWSSNKKEEVHAVVCRLTVLPPNSRENRSYVSMEADVLADILINTSLTSQLTPYLRSSLASVGWISHANGSYEDLHLLFGQFENSGSKACPSGRQVLLTLTCDDNVNEKVELPSQCPDGTCDGCLFLILLRGLKACTFCRSSDFEVVRSECISGQQKVHYYPPKHCVLHGYKKAVEVVSCPLLNNTAKTAAAVALTILLILVTILLYCWKKNRKLEYRYMKLQEYKDCPGTDMELPQAESCAMHEDDEDEIDIRITGTHSNTRLHGLGFMKSAPPRGGGKKKYNQMENVNLTEDADNFDI